MTRARSHFALVFPALLIPLVFAACSGADPESVIADSGATDWRVALPDVGDETRSDTGLTFPDGGLLDVPDGVASPDYVPELVPQCDPGEGCFLDECTANAQCQSGWCVEHMGKGVCAMTCQDECPPGWSCQQVTETFPDVVYLCVSDHANLCKPCASSADCQSLGGADDVCVDYGDEGSFCGGPCGKDLSCPNGFTCQEVLSTDSIPVTRCVADAGTCECTDKSVTLALWTPCERSNEWGICTGKRVCTKDGLGECDAVLPAQETCDGIDQDCDGETDEPALVGGKYVPVCDDGNECTQDTCNGAGGCSYAPLSDVPCNGGDVCSGEYTCQDGACVGTSLSCDDGKLCTVDTCDPVDGHCVHTPKDANCPGSNNPCIGTVFCDPFADVESDPNQDGCVVIYKPAGTGCNDSDACTSGETCQQMGTNMICLGEPVDLDDGNACTNDWCDPATGPKHDPIPDCQVPCEPGEVMSGQCGMCGIHTKVCPDTGKWSDGEWSECTGQGDCTPGINDSAACGNCGTHSRTCTNQCQWGEWTPCANEGTCTPGEDQFEACGENCSSKKRTCTDACQWGIWGECTFEGACNPGDFESQACGNCGTQMRGCTNLCQWSPWGECANQGTCETGAQQSQACGACGTQTRACTEQCQWGGWSQCGGEGACFPGQTKTQACGNCGSQTATCNDQCQWGAWGQCTDQGICSPGAEQTQACNQCGTQKRTCTNQCQWGNWGACAGQGICAPGQQQSQACGNCGTQSRTCSNQCTWPSWGTCQNQGACSPGANDSQACGNCGTQYRSCSNSCQWNNWGSCQNQGVCSPFQTDFQNCGNCGTQERSCGWDCQWDNWGQCDDPCACECWGGTCCTDGCNYDSYGTSCGDCKKCNGSGSCSLNKSNGTNCPGGECYNGSCVECLSGDTQDCDPNCGVFNDYGDGEETCSNNQWGTCKPVWCKGGPWPVEYSVAPNDHDWHCAYHSEFGIYLCVKALLSWICADYIEFSLMKSWNVYGTSETGPWDNDIKVVLRNKNTGKTWTQNKVSCAGNTSTSGGCYFTVGLSTLRNTLGVNGTDSLEVDIYSPYTNSNVTGTTGIVKLERCF